MKYVTAFFEWLMGCHACHYGKLRAELAIERTRRKKAEERWLEWESEARELRLEIYGVPESVPKDWRG